jgi:peptidoglycan/LPS O-acetylase OafA/YrhL
MDLEKPLVPSHTLRNLHRIVLATIAGCALVSALQTPAAEQLGPDRRSATVAVCLALGSIVARRLATRAGVSPNVRSTLTLCAYALAAAIAVLGVFLAATQGAVQTGLVFALAAGIFCLRPPPAAEPARHGDRPGRDGSSADT